MATITLTITKDGTAASPDSGDHATVVFDDENKRDAGAFLDSLSWALWISNWRSAFDVVKERERKQDAAAETGQ